MTKTFKPMKSSRPEPIKLQLPIMLLSNAPKFSLLYPSYASCAQLCSILLLMLLPDFEDKFNSLNYIYFTAVESTKFYN